jgi:outer membrane protein assembly factor BamB
MKSPIYVSSKKHAVSLKILALLLTIAPLWLVMAAANASADAQTSDTSRTSSTSLASSPADWTQFHRDNMQRWNPFETTLGINNANELKAKWSSKRFVPDDERCFSVFVTGPTIANGMAYYGSDDGSLYALNASDGARLWSLPCVGVVSTPAVANGVLYFVSLETDSLDAVNARTGATLWSYGPLGGFLNESRDFAPTIVDGAVHLNSAVGDVYAVNASSGALLWRSSIGVSGLSPAVANGIVYVGNGAGLFALDAKTGVLLWNSFDVASIFNSPAVANGLVYVGFFIQGSTGFGVAAFDAKTGVQRWIYAAESNLDNVGQIVGSSPAVADGMVYIGSEAGTVYALDANTGTLKWTYQTGGTVNTSPAVANGVVYLTDGKKDIALNAATGRLLWSYPITNATLPPGTIGFGASSPAIVNGVAYFSCLFIYQEWRAGGEFGFSFRVFFGSRFVFKDKAMDNDRPPGRPTHLRLPGVESGSRERCS